MTERIEKKWWRTNEIRFVERSTFTEAGVDLERKEKFMTEISKITLQQKFELRSLNDKFGLETDVEHEWRDVPLFIE